MIVCTVRVLKYPALVPSDISVPPQFISESLKAQAGANTVTGILVSKDCFQCVYKSPFSYSPHITDFFFKKTLVKA